MINDENILKQKVGELFSPSYSRVICVLRRGKVFGEGKKPDFNFTLEFSSIFGEIKVNILAVSSLL